VGFDRVYGREGAFEKAVKAFDEAILLDGGEAEYFCDMAQLYQTEGYTDKAIEKWKKSNELAPNRVEILLALGNTYLMAQRYPEAVREYRELLELRPEMEPQLVKGCARRGMRRKRRRWT
jgi:tetratricopeptide (TPR) repeat protein